MKKPFKETKVGKLITEKLPQVGEIIGEALPENGVLGVVKNIISGSNLSAEEKAALQKELHDFELEIYRLEVQDRESARSREVELKKAGGKDWMMPVVGIVVLLFTSFTIYAIFYTELKNGELPHFIAGEILGFASSLVFYYYGTSKSSSDKNDIIKGK